MAYFDTHKEYLDGLLRAGQSRSLNIQTGAIFSSNDYLALAASDELKSAAQNAINENIPIGSGGSRLLSGNHIQHVTLENEAADFFQSETALFFANGYAANVAAISSLPQKGDVIFYDALIHASSHDGMRLARCNAHMFAHNDSDDLVRKIKSWRAENGDINAQIWIIFETLYSMDGDIAPIDEFNAIATQHDAILIIDEAHATGVYGRDGRGLAAHLDGQDNVIILRTLGKALGCEGALLCLPAAAKEFLINRARHFIFSTAPSPLMASIARSALRIMVAQPQRREKLMQLCSYATDKLTPLGALSHGSPIIPIIIGDAPRTMEIATALQDQGFDIRGIRPPTVPQDSSRLRICISLNIDRIDIDNLATALKQIL